MHKYPDYKKDLNSIYEELKYSQNTLILKEDNLILEKIDELSCELNKFNSTNNAIQRFNETIDILISIGNFSIINESINIIGDESKSLEKKGYTDLLAFRIKNIIVVMSSPEYSLTLELAKIVEQRIKKNNY